MKDSTNPVEEKNKKEGDPHRMIRGGNGYDHSDDVWVSIRSNGSPKTRIYFYVGFRLVKNKSKK
jgi:formylglycine-generating enzyme required for sulfatase activity